MGKCIQCGSAIMPLRPYIYRSKTFEKIYRTGQVFSCPSCGLNQADASDISDEALGDYYRSAYRQEAKITSNDLPENQRYYRARARALLSLASQHIDRPVQRIFEVGAGYGYNLAEAGRIYPAAALLTDELDENLKNAMGAQQASLSSGAFDIVIMSHVLEHFTDPKSWLLKARQALAPGGIVVVEVPNDAMGFSSVTDCDEPHISFFSAKTLRQMVESVSGFHIASMFAAGPSFQSPRSKKRLVLKLLSSKAPGLYAFLLRLRTRQRGTALPDFTTPNPNGIFLRAAVKGGALPT